MTPTKSQIADHPQRSRAASRTAGNILIPVVLMLSVVATVSFLVSFEGATNSAATTRELESRQAALFAEAGYAEAKWLLDQTTTCSGYSDLPATAFGAGTYSAVVTPTNGSLVTLAATGGLATGAERTIRRDNLRVHGPRTTETLQLGSVGGKDTLLDDFYTIRNFGGANYLQVSSVPGWDKQRPLVQFDLSSLPTDVTILSARLELKHLSTGAAGVASIYRMTRDWVEGTKSGGGIADGATWIARNGALLLWTSPGGEFDPEAVAATAIDSATEGGWVAWEIGSLVGDWVAGSVSNSGLLIKGDGVLSTAKFASREAANPSDAPRLVVTYACECGTTGSSNALTLKPGASGGVDSFLNEANQTQNYQSITSIRVDNAPGIRQRGILRFDLSSVPPGTTLVSAELRLELTQIASGGSGTAYVHRVNRAWTEEGVSWIQADGSSNWSSTGGDYDSGSIASAAIEAATPGQISWDITSLASGWISGGVPNDGLLLTVNSGLTGVRFASSDSGTTTAHPALILTYTCPCGVVCGGGGGGGGGELLMVVADPASLSSQDLAKQSLIESWGYVVTTIDSSDSQTAYDLAAATSDVVFITNGVSDLDLGSKLVATPIGVVFEQRRLGDEFGLATGSTTFGTSWLSIANNGHYITAPFSVGEVTLFSSAQATNRASGSLAPDLTVLGTFSGLGGLVVLDQRDELVGGASAAGRRVQLPWGDASGFDVNALTGDGQTLLRRSLEWGATVPPPPEGYLDEFNSFTCDMAVDYIGSDGALDWSESPWLEQDDGSSCFGNKWLLEDQGSTRLGVAGGGWIDRMVDLSSFASATLEFDYLQIGDITTSRYLIIAASGDGGSNWTEIGRINTPGDGSTYLAASYSIPAALLNANSAIRFGPVSMQAGREIYLDNVRIVGGTGGGSGPSQFGFEDEFASTQSSVRRLQIATQVTLPEDGTLTSMTGYVGGRNRNVRYAIYSDVSGEPSDLLAESPNILTDTPMDWVEGTVPDTALAAGTYWLALSFDDNLQQYVYVNGGETRYSDHRATLNGFSSTWGTSTNTLSRSISIYGTYTPDN